MNIRTQQTNHALGSDCSITITYADNQDVTPLFKDLWAIITDFENRFSRFKTDSELSRFNNRAGETTEISLAFRDLLQVSREYSALTDGIFNPFILPDLQRAGYIGSWPAPDTYVESQNYQNRHHQNPLGELEIGESWARIPKNSAVDFGGIGKGYALKELADYLSKKPVVGFWISLGGDIVCSGLDQDNNSWSIGIAQVITEPLSIQSVKNTDGEILSVATSGITKRQGTHNNKQWHHIIDPRTGIPAETDILAATAVTTNPIAADIFAKCAVITGSMQLNELIKADPKIRYVLQLKNNTAKVIEAEGILST